jgi:hypothetical protein
MTPSGIQPSRASAEKWAEFTWIRVKCLVLDIGQRVPDVDKLSVGVLGEAADLAHA